jgi:NADPH:quinone reductase-like Zn-dependent oxidoreductase
MSTKIVRFHEVGGADVLRIESVPLAEPGPGEARIRVGAMSLNRADALFRSGRYLYQPQVPNSRIGTDIAGIVEAVGEGVENVRVGMAVLTFPGFNVSTHGTHGETAIVPAAFLEPYPETIPPNEAASISLPYVTVWGALNDFGGMTKGDVVLITAASSSVGVAAIQMARAVGAIPIAATRGASKKQGLLDVGAEHVIVTNEENLAERVMDVTQGKGARLIFDPIAGDMLEPLAGAATPGGIVFLYGALSPAPSALPLFPVLMKDLRFWGYSVYGVFGNPERRERAFRDVFGGFENGTLKVLIDRTFSLDDYAASHRHLESNEQLGRIVVVP